MKSKRPSRVAIDPDDYHARHVGHTRDGRQFFLTTPFEPAVGDSKGCEYVALFLFDRKGKLLSSDIHSFGPRATASSSDISACHMRLLESLGETEAERIEVIPFEVEKFGAKFGLIAREPEDEDDEWAVEMLPGNYMAFFEPWDSGEYDT